MYPSLHSNSNHSISSLASSQSAPTQPSVDQTHRFSANGPSTPTSASSAVFNVLRVRVADALCITPPVMLSAHLGNIPRTEYSQSFDYEHEVLRDYPLNSQAPSADNIPDTTAADVQRYTQMGHSREAVAMALVAVQGSEDRDTQVVKFLEEFNNLKAMGFASHIVAGALIACPNDAAEATEACLSASS